MKHTGFKRFKRGAIQNYLEPITTKAKRKKFTVYDIESKNGNTDEAGFTRPFLVGFFDPEKMKYLEYRDEPHLRRLHPKNHETWHIRPGGCVDKFMNMFLTKTYAGSVIYAHNGGSFDHLFLLAWLTEHRDEFGYEVVPVQSSIQVLRVWRVPEDPKEKIKEKWEFLDSMKLMPMSLEKACKSFGLPGKISQDLNMPEMDPRWSIYLKQDCIALATVMTKYHDLVEHVLGGEVGITTPSTAVKLFRRKFMGKDGTPAKIARYVHWPTCQEKGTIKNPGPCTGCMHQWIRGGKDGDLTGYCGGRTEIWKLKGENIHYYDVSSSYVASMRYDMPIGTRVIEDGGKDHDWVDWRKHRSKENPKGNYSGFCECTVFIPHDCPVPPLPYKDRERKKLIFPAGQFHGIWSLEELTLLKDPFVGGEIRHVVKTVWFRLLPMFLGMVTELWKFRDPKREGYDEGLSLLAKLLGNGTYGKFAMRQERTSVVFRQDVEEGQCILCKADVPMTSNGTGGSVPQGLFCKEHEGSKSATHEPGDVWYQRVVTDATYIIPHVAAHITADARVRIWRVMKMVIERGGTIFYVDTDSCLTDVELPTSTKLGELKDEYPNDLLRYEAVQPKVYIIEKMGFNEEVAKHNEGVAEAEARIKDLMAGKKREIEDEDFHLLLRRATTRRPHFKLAMKGSPLRMRTKENFEILKAGGVIRWDQLEKVRSLARQGFQRPPMMREDETAISKSFKSTYDKRIVLTDGSTSNIVLDEPLGGYDETQDLDVAAE